MSFPAFKEYCAERRQAIRDAYPAWDDLRVEREFRSIGVRRVWHDARAALDGRISRLDCVFKQRNRDWQTKLGLSLRLRDLNRDINRLNENVTGFDLFNSADTKALYELNDDLTLRNNSTHPRYSCK